MDTQIVDVAPQLVAMVRRKVPLAAMGQAQRDGRRLLAEALRAAHLPDSHALTVWRPPEDGRIDYAPGMIVPLAFEVPEGVSFAALPEGRAAHRVHHGPYEELAGAWQRLFDDCRTQGLVPAGINWEVYAAAGATPETELYAALA